MHTQFMKKPLSTIGGGKTWDDKFDCVFSVSQLKSVFHLLVWEFNGLSLSFRLL